MSNENQLPGLLVFTADALDTFKSTPVKRITVIQRSEIQAILIDEERVQITMKTGFNHHMFSDRDKFVDELNAQLPQLHLRPKE